MAEHDRPKSRMEEGLRNTEIKRETDVHNSLGPEAEGEGTRDREPNRDTGRMRDGERTRGRDTDRSTEE